MFFVTEINIAIRHNTCACVLVQIDERQLKVRGEPELLFDSLMSFDTASPSRRHAVAKFLGILTSIFGALVWLATIATLFGLWARDDFIQYEYDDGDVAYISNVGARHKAVFIVGTALTGLLFILTLILTKICFDAETRRRLKRGVSITSIVFGVIAGLSLCLLAILDSVNYKGAHYAFTGLFIVFTLLSAVFSIAYRFTRNEMNLVTNLRVLFVSLVVPLAIAFVVFSLIKRPATETQLKSVAASIEWSIALLFVVYLALFALDFILNS